MMPPRRRTRCLLALLFVINVARGDFNYEVQRRVKERITNFMERPVTVTGVLGSYFDNGGFSNSLQAVDRSDYLTLDFSLLQNFYEMDLIYYGLEDGTCVGIGKNQWGYYREPGEGGYSATDVPDELLKHYESCVNKTTGEPQNCTDVGIYYIECIDDCEYIPCPDEASQRNCSSQDESCEKDVKWCQNYRKVEAPPDVELGYIPGTSFCHNDRGKFTEENCTYADGMTPVRRNVTGTYAHCGTDNETCNDTFVGGYESSNYDPRARGWYETCKEEQAPTWSDPYPYHNVELGIGITYTKPLYTEIVDSDGERKTVFHGVLAVDYSFQLIAEFLQESYSNTSTLVAVCEYADPSYVIGSSTGGKATKNVLASDKSTPCPAQDAEECENVRIPMAELSDQPMDSVLVRAFHKLMEADFPSDNLVTVRQTDDQDSEVYVAQSQVWEQPDIHNLKWRIIVVMPSSKNESDAIVAADTLFPVVCLIAGAGFLLCLLLLIAFYRKRTERAVIFADWRFTIAFIFGCTMLNTSSFTLLGPNTDPLCMLRMWSFHWLFVAAMSPLLVKVWRMKKLVGIDTPRRVKISNTKAAAMTLPLVLVQTIILVMFSIFDRPKETIVVEAEEGILTQHSVCQQSSSAFMIVQFIFEAGLVLAGCILSYQTRNLDPRFGEAKQLIAAMYNIAFIGLIIIILVAAMDISRTSEIILQSVGVFWGTVFSSAAFVLPRLIAVRDDKQRRKDVARRRTTVSGLASAAEPTSTAEPQEGLASVAEPTSTAEPREDSEHGESES